MKNYKILLVGLFAVTFFSCVLLEPEPDNYSTLDRIYEDPAFAEGLLARGWVQIPIRDYGYSERATDDAVTNQLTNDYVRMAAGGWSSLFNPQHIWQNCMDGIMYMNLFLSVVDNIPFRPSNSNMDMMFKRCYKGEAYCLRGILKYYLLQNHGGMGANGQLLGFPIFNEFVEITEKDKLSRPRASFAECVQSVYDDLDMAISLLPFDFGGTKDVNVTSIPDGYNVSPTATLDDYLNVCGVVAVDRASGRIAATYKAKMALLHASPSFNTNNDGSLWEKAAVYAGEVLAKPSIYANSHAEAFKGGLHVAPQGHVFYTNAEVGRYNWNTTPPTFGAGAREFIWRKNKENNNTKEVAQYPPTFNGGGQINPSQNFVDAFPMANGYPITADPAISGYISATPYANRDARLNNYVVRNGTTGFRGTSGTGVNSVVWTADDATGTHAGNNRLGVAAASTRTGYYLRKLLNENVTYGTSWNTADHIDGWIRFTEMYLLYAEAANQAWGPDVSRPEFPYTARNVIRAIRSRANTGLTSSGDPYLNSLDQAGMIELIQNERRIELSFEGHRFWDLRRWKKTDLMNQTVRGVRWANNTPTYFDVEPRKYQDYMIYGPVPQTEIMKFNYVQNQGW